MNRHSLNGSFASQACQVTTVQAETCKLSATINLPSIFASPVLGRPFIFIAWVLLIRGHSPFLYAHPFRLLQGNRFVFVLQRLSAGCSIYGAASMFSERIRHDFQSTFKRTGIEPGIFLAFSPATHQVQRLAGLNHG